MVQWLRLHASNAGGFPCGSAGKELACNAGDLGLIPGLGRSPGEGIGYLLQYSCASLDRLPTPIFLRFPGGLDSKESSCSAKDLGSIPGLGRSPREGKGYPLQYSGLENSMDRGAWQATVHGVTKSLT